MEDQGQEMSGGWEEDQEISKRKLSKKDEYEADRKKAFVLKKETLLQFKNYLNYKDICIRQVNVFLTIQ